MGFCSHAAMQMMSLYLPTLLSSGVFEEYGPEFPDFVQPQDILLGRCMGELGIRLVDMYGYFAGHHTPGTIHSNVSQGSDFREGLPEIRLADITRPALWHKVTQ